MIKSHEYRLHLRGTGIKTGEFVTITSDLPLLEVASPPEFGGPGMTWSPEHLFLAAISSCLMTTFRAIASKSELEVVAYTDDSSAQLVRDPDGLYRMASVTLRPRVFITDPSKTDLTLRLLDKAEKACLISRSYKAEVRMEKTVEVVHVLARETV